MKSNNSKTVAFFSDVAAVVNSMKSDKTIMHLIEITARANGDDESVELPPDNELDNLTKSALLLVVL